MSSTKKQARGFPQQLKLSKPRHRLSIWLKTQQPSSLGRSKNDWNFSNQEQGFTLLELLVAIIIIGILSAIALPTLLRQANKAKEVEATTRVRNLLQLQHEYYITNGEFANSLGELGFSLSYETEQYQYMVLPPQPLLDGSVLLGLSKQPELKSYAGVVFLQDGQTNTCPKIPIDINTDNLNKLIIPLIFKILANPKEYCS
ncbi:MAG: prepilin-type N-terminal cleavage/methylation domain-containing protein [Moorea sp. SIO1G6]|uniref:type IV pilin-like G/H family protein n=1 Tax=Moorena sp. SIO1G6 TaxID=2607840 RepID=UPI0013C26AA9|nr:type IV pilin-like G/H family protein [Moorena sp. SIO1G6]NET68172.1 prepilin-type N-terminal cleavage/methylation domain-containing protein [Moorena sp. SIO1G6]